MERKISRIAKLVREELSSVKMMILSIMMSFGLVLSIMNFLVNMFSALETAGSLKGYMRSPYDAEMNSLISTAINGTFIFQIVGFFLSFIPFALMTFGIYLLYANARKDSDKTSGMKLVGGVFKYHGIMSFITAVLMVVLGIAIFVLVIIFQGDISGYVGDSSEEFAVALIIMAVMFMGIFAVVGLVYVGRGVVMMFLAGNMKYIGNTQKGKLFKKMSIFGIIILLIVGIDSLLSIFSSFTAVGFTNDDIEMLEEMLGGQATQILMDAMPSRIVQFETMAVSIAYTFFVGVSQILAAVILLGIRSKIKRVLEEQEIMNYGGENFTGSN